MRWLEVMYGVPPEKKPLRRSPSPVTRVLLACLVVTGCLTLGLLAIGVATWLGLTYQPWGMLALVPTIFVCCLVFALAEWGLDKVWSEESS